jgi:hypothetical protein
MNLHKRYKLHPYPWTLDRNQIRDANGWAIGSVPFSLGDETDQSSGRLMAKAPELLDAAGLALRTINDTLRHENLSAGGYEALEMAANELREAIHEKLDQFGNIEEGGKP